MKKKLLLILLFIGSYSFAQFNESAPWMVDLAKKKKSVQAKARDSQASGPQVYSIYEISEAFHKYWEGRDKNVKGSGYKPYMRWENYWQHLVDENGYLPSPQELWASWEDKNSKAMAVNPTADWTSIGPFEPGIQAIGLPGTGRVNQMAVDPNDATIWYAGAPAGGIWKSTNAGDSWTTLFDDFPQIGVSGIAIDPNDSNTIYIATGDDDAGDSFSVGVFKSTDGGATWDETGLNPSNTDEATRMNEIVIDPTNSDIVWVGTNAGLQKSLDGGDTWEVKRVGNITDFKLKPDDPNTIYAVSPNQYFRSTDGGDTFTAIADILPTAGGRMVLGVSPANADVLYILAADTIGNSSAYLGLFKSTDAGLTFTESPNTADIFESNQAWFDLALEIDPSDEDILYTGVLNIWKSIDGGDSFTQLNDWSVNNPAYAHADIHTLKFFNGILFAGTDGGLYTSDDGGVTFVDETANMAITQFYRISVGKSDGSRIAGGTQDNSGYVLNNGDWNLYTGGDGMDYEVDPTNSNIIYGFLQFGGFLFVTTSAGQTISFVAAPTDAMGETIQGNWITPLTVAPDGSVYSGFDSVYRLDGSGAWERISGNLGNGGIEDLEADPNDPMILYAAEGSTLYRSDDGAVIFDDIHTFDSPISDIAINDNDSNVVYVTTSNRVGISQISQPATRGVFRVTLEATGAVVDDLTLNLPTDQAYFSIVHQARHTDNPIFVGTNLGVYRLDDTLTEWEDYFTNLPNTAVGDLEINVDDETITASTYGRGAWQSPLPIQAPDDDVRLVSVTPPSGRVQCGEIFPELVVENKGLNPITSIDVTYDINGGATQDLTWTGTLNSGETTTIQLPSLSFTDFGPTDLNTEVSITNDAFPENNSSPSTFIPNNFANGGQVFDFESDAGDLVTYNEIGAEGSVWERGVPEGTLLNTASSGTQVYGTNLDGNHPDQTKGIILSGCYEMSNILAPVLKFNMAYDLEINFDIVFVEYSTDDGLSWNLLGQLGSQPNWYNSDRTNASSGAADDCQNCPGGQWTGTDATMTEYAYDFIANAAAGETDLTVEDNVLFRIVFQSDPSFVLEGAIVDDFRVEGFQDDDDDDNDGVLDVDDNCPLVGNANQLDTDGDGAGDVCDDDDDNDGVLDIDDNCPLTANADQADGDGDGIGDVCDDDLDNDGVPNAIDLCDDTPADAVVDVDGCEVFSLPADNFEVKTIGESCIANNNGSIEIEASSTLNYVATLSDGAGPDIIIDFTDTGAFTDLVAGNYTVCITVDGQAGYERCFDVTIGEPEALDVGSKVSSLNNEVTLSLSGGKTYYIELNGDTFSTSRSEITLPLNKIENVLSVRTDQDCQGSHDETIVLTSQIFIYPNPVSTGELNIYLGSNEFEQIETSIFNINGKQVFTKSVAPNNGYVNMNISGLSQGIYLLNIKTERSLLNYKIVRK